MKLAPKMETGGVLAVSELLIPPWVLERVQTAVIEHEQFFDGFLFDGKVKTVKNMLWSGLA